MLRLRIFLLLLILQVLPVFLPDLHGQDGIISVLGSPEEGVAASDEQVPDSMSFSARGERESSADAQVTDTLSVSPHGERTSSFTPGADLVSSYIWRGSRQGSGPHIQPYIEYSFGIFTAGAWGTIDLNGYEEADLWFSFELPGGFAVGMQDYYLPDLPYFDYSAADGSHALELNLDWASDFVWLSANCIINEAGGVGSYGRDLYFEAGFSFEFFSLFMGSGTGWHTEENNFNVCNLGLEVCREIVVTDTFTLPLTARMVFNPDREQLFVTAGISLAFSSGE